jgi:NAD+ kinase
MALKLGIVGSPPASFTDLVRGAGLAVVADAADADLLVCYGGDGSLIGAERDHPHVPKLGLRRDDSCAKCERHRDAVVVERLAKGKLPQERLLKLEARCGKIRLAAMNDVIFRNADPRSAVRFRVSLNGAVVTEEVIGDGVVIATPFGSSAYFRSITHLTFRAGLGIAFNNCTDFQPHLVVAERDVVSITLTRGPATLASDNDPRQYPMQTGDVLTVRRATKPARVLCPDTLRCPDCRYKNAPRRRY